MINLKSTLLIAVVFLLSLPGCGKKDELTAHEKITVLLTSSIAWQNPEVTVDNIDYSELYNDFSISFERGAYTTTSGAPIWRASGTWAFLNEEATLLKFDNVTEVEINSISDETLELTLFWDTDTFEPGRVKSVRGKNKFKLKKKR